MASHRHTKTEKKEEMYDVSINTFIERLKKARALNCNPSYIGIDSYLYRQAFSNGGSDLLAKPL